ncbi:MAG TPA: fatty acid hydroxylase [Prosthecobacter sp.]
MFAIFFFAAFVVAIFYASFFEWLLHKYVMHRPFPGFKYPFKSHAGVHHRVFRADQTYHLKRETDRKTIPMAWWNGPALVIIGSLPFAICAWLFGAWSIIPGAVIAIAAYYAVYETIHWCMHLPKARRLEISWLFRRLNGHHLLHHRYMHKNFNVVLPLADLCLGTLLIRSKIRFAQAMGPSVPNVQPIELPRGTW